MSDVSLLRFLNGSDPSVQGDVLSLIAELELEEPGAYGVRALEYQQPRRQSFGSFEAERAIQVRHFAPIFRPHYKPDLSAFEPFYEQLSLFPNG